MSKPLPDTEIKLGEDEISISEGKIFITLNSDNTFRNLLNEIINLNEEECLHFFPEEYLFYLDSKIYVKFRQYITEIKDIFNLEMRSKLYYRKIKKPWL